MTRKLLGTLVILAYPVVSLGIIVLVNPEPRNAPGVTVFLVFLLLGFIPACVTAWLAAAKGRGGCLWFALGFFFNWLAMLVALWLPAAAGRAAYEGPTETCDRYQGRGYIMNLAERARTGRTDTAIEPCPVCGGTGRIPE